MADVDRDTTLRLAAFEHVRKLGETHDHLTTTELKPGFVFEGERIPLMKRQRGIFKRRCCMNTRCEWGGVTRTSLDPPQEPHYRDEVEGPSHV